MINLFHLKYFYDSCFYQSLAKASAKNKVSHSAVSQAIRALENSIGIELLEHSKRRFILTEEGHSLFVRASRIFETVDEVVTSLKSNEKVVNGNLKIGMSHSVALHFSSSFIAKFSKLYPDVQLSIRIANSSTLCNALLAREIDIGIGIDDSSSAEIERFRLLKGRFILVENKMKKAVSHSLPYLVGDKGSEIVCLRKFLNNEINSPKFHVIQSWELIRELVYQGLGIGLIPDFMFKKGDERIRIHRTEYSLPFYEISIFTRPNSNIPRVATKFLNEIQYQILNEK